MKLTILLAKEKQCTVNLPVLLIGELFECRTVAECEKLFVFIEGNVQIWKEEFFFKNIKTNILRACNDLLRRLSQYQNTVFCGRILIFLADFFPLFERSGLNLASEFNLDNSTNFDLNDTSKEEPSENPEDDKFKIDSSFYRKFWQIQEYFRNPNICYAKTIFKQLATSTNDVLSVFGNYKIDPNSCLYFQTLGLDSNEEFNVFFSKYLTNQKLLKLQLSDSNFRRHILIQYLILFQYLSFNVKANLRPNAKPKIVFELSEEQSAWIRKTTKQVYQLIEETPPNGKELSDNIGRLLKREEFWSNWKSYGCPEVKEIVRNSDEDASTSEYIRSTYGLNNNKARLGDYVLNANKANKIIIGNAETNRLWNFCPDNMEACRYDLRESTPTIEQFFGSTFAMQPEVRQMNCSDPNFCWKALRLLSQKSRHFFVQSTQMVQPVNEYLDNTIKRLAEEYNKQTNNQQNDVDNNKAETEDISDDELLKNADSNSVKSADDDLMDVGEVKESQGAPEALQQADQLSDAAIEQVAAKVQRYWDQLSPLFGFHVSLYILFCGF